VPTAQPLVFNGTVGELLSQPEFAGILGFDLDIPIVAIPGIELSWQVADNFCFGGWAGNQLTLSTGNGLFSRGDINLTG